MELTPIKIRGKGPRKKGWRPPKKQRSLTGTPAASPSPKIRGMEGAAPIEKLPIEIVERIFLLSGNLDLPRASLRIGYNLSGRSSLLRLLLANYAPTWDRYLGCSRVAEDGGECRLEFFASFTVQAPFKVGFQDHSLLSCPWATVDMVLDAVGIWQHRGGRGKHFHRTLTRCVPVQWTQSSGVRRQARCENSLHKPEDPGPFTSIRECFELDWEAFVAEPDGCFRTIIVAYIPPLARSEVPYSLATGPFDWEKARMLFWLLCNSAIMPGRELQSSWEPTKVGFDNILKIDDDKLAYVVARLFYVWEVFKLGFWPASVRIQARRVVDSYPIDTNDTPDTAIGLLRFALAERSDVEDM